jgi:NAD(P)-dependent dehydrogenase (short-subunit alcohol dehydrogenase family)
MEKQGSGHIVQITTSLVDHAVAGVPAVLATLTKGGLNAATRSLAIEYAQRGIRVNAVAPGTIKTSMHSVAEYAQLAALHPVGRLGEISDIVDAILYLEGASFVTGENRSRRWRPERRPLTPPGTRMEQATLCTVSLVLFS